MNQKILASIRKFLFKMDPWQFLLAGGVGIVLIIYFAFNLTANFIISGPTEIYFLIGVSLFLLLNRLLIISRFGIRLSYFFFFGLVLVFGPIVTILVRVLPVVLHLKLSTMETKFDFILKKEFKTILNQTKYAIALILLITGTVFIFGKTYIIENLSKIFINLYIFWTILLFGKRILLHQRIATWRSLMPGVSLLLNMWLINNFGHAYINYLMSL